MKSGVRVCEIEVNAQRFSAFSSQPRSCQLQPDYNSRKYPDFCSAVEAEQAARWNAYCFFSMELRPTHLAIRFRKTATELLYGPLKEDCLRFMRQMLLPFRPTG